MPKRSTPDLQNSARGLLMALAYINGPWKLDGNDLPTAKRLANLGFVRRAGTNTYEITPKGNQWLRDYVDYPALKGLAPFQNNPSSTQPISRISTDADRSDPKYQWVSFTVPRRITAKQARQIATEYLGYPATGKVKTYASDAAPGAREVHVRAKIGSVVRNPTSKGDVGKAGEHRGFFIWRDRLGFLTAVGPGGASISGNIRSIKDMRRRIDKITTSHQDFLARQRKNPSAGLEAFSRASLGERVYSEVFRSGSGVVHVSLIQLPGKPTKYDLHIKPVGEQLYPVGPLTKSQARAKLKKLRAVLMK